MSAIPPHIDTDTGTPSGEWAQSTTTAAFARTDPASGVSLDAPKQRPVNPKSGFSQEDVPGAYPAAADMSSPNMTVKDSAVHAAEVSYAYAASAASTAAAYLPKGVVDTVSSYMRECPVMFPVSTPFCPPSLAPLREDCVRNAHILAS